WWGNWVPEIYSEQVDYGLADPVVVVADENTSDVDFTLEIGGSISGTVTEQGTDNEPVVDMEVAACPYDFDSGEYLEGMPCYSGWTETDGSYFIRGVPAGTYIVDSGWWGNWVPEIYSEQVDYGLADPVVVVADENTPDINFTLERGSSISGTVTEQGTGAPIEGMVVDVCDYETGWDTCFHGWTEADGTYFISGIPTGTYRMFSGWDDSNWMVEYYNEQAAWELATPVDVEANTELSGINFTLEMGGSISGVVTEQDTGAPIEGVVVDICDYETGFDGPCYGGFTEADGSYFIAGIQPGTYRVFSGWDHTNWVVEYYNEQADWELAELVEIEANTDLYEIDFTLELGGSISGTVTEQGAGAPIEGKMVEACDYVAGWDGPCFRDWTRADGSYFIPGVPAGIYRVSSSWEGTWMVEYYNEQADWELADPVEVTVNRDTPNINFSLEMSE
ncbi:MAG TPA: carboxypeptidase-like regulatory domain-containing protein, partial [Anaerolineales bacterium]|nr:carboxypeptidase-like regulatory domain-containing protein [Anaerolineales bacterium]